MIAMAGEPQLSACPPAASVRNRGQGGVGSRTRLRGCGGNQDGDRYRYDGEFAVGGAAELNPIFRIRLTN